MAHVLAKLRDVKFEDVKNMLKADMLKHGEQGLYLKHVWRNADDSGEVLFIFQTNDLSRARKYIESIHAQVLKENPQANLPKMTYLDDR
ncbi:hypothetical protein NTE_00570 [Candidatus Nitrososphaera evergladensis SR1]|jgi:hypothetical protein|uniref:Uncharacterized protein n=1 Tax=Candidatus Nitrososphaera evergladensis SR1 TaxID=1459636 RepID=A0A075MMF2_9ARCH|nr:hypothetical protein [Candidatus Nitrososphaera evergladensis]AIF82651.1 hypothetical protein NTE_00570 [Candidatus Nitrososphaera evergladensis SR1]